MADYRLSGYTTEASVATDNQNCGSVFNTTTSGDALSNWNAIRAGTEGSPSLSVNDLRILSSRTAATPRLSVRRSYIQFPIPNNLSRLDNTPILSVYTSGFYGDRKIVPTSITYTNFTQPWSGNNATNAFTSAQTGASAKYIDDSFYYLGGGTNLITLNELAKFHILLGGGVSNGVSYLTIALLDYTYDFLGAVPDDGDGHSVTFDGPSDSNPPSLTLRNPWFINDKGAEFPVDGNFVIAANDIGVNQFDRSVPQLPFSQNIRGPRSLRGKNVPYKVTT